MKPHSGDNGIEYLTALIRAQFDPDGAAAARPEPTGDEAKGEKAGTQERLQETQQPALF